MKFFQGIRTEKGCVVNNDGAPLNPRLDLFNHSPSGFEWGFSGSGPAQLALALASAVLGPGKKNDARAVKIHQTLKEKLVAGFPSEGWILNETEIMNVIRECEQAAQ